MAPTQGEGIASQQLREQDAISQQQLPCHRFSGVLNGLFRFKQPPAAVTAPAMLLAPGAGGGAPRSLGSPQPLAHALETVGGRHTGGGQGPQGLLDVTGQALGGGYDVREEGSAATLQVLHRLPCRARQFVRGNDSLGEEPVQRLSECQGRWSRAGEGCAPPGRSPTVVLSLSTARAESSPDYLSAQAKTVQHNPAVFENTIAEDFLFNHPSGGLEALQFLNNGQQPRLALKLCIGSHMLPFKEETDERRRGYRVYLAAQRFDGGTVYSRQNPSVAELFVLRLPAVAAPQDDTLVFKLRDRIQHIVFRQG